MAVTGFGVMRPTVGDEISTEAGLTTDDGGADTRFFVLVLFLEGQAIAFRKNTRYFSKGVQLVVFK